MGVRSPSRSFNFKLLVKLSKESKRDVTAGAIIPRALAGIIVAVAQPEAQAVAA